MFTINVFVNRQSDQVFALIACLRAKCGSASTFSNLLYCCDCAMLKNVVCYMAVLNLMEFFFFQKLFINTSRRNIHEYKISNICHLLMQII